MRKVYKKNSLKKGFTLIELLVAMFIFAMVMGGMVAVSVAGFRSYQKSKAIKTVTEDVGFAINSITKDVRMGKIESADNVGNTLNPSLVVTLNHNQTKVCYSVSSASLNVCDGVCGSCKSIVDLAGTGMTFDTSTSGFRNQKSWPVASPTVRGWAEINLNIASPSMDTDSISVQTIVSLRDYGWENVTP
ncbi:MAG: prepilin-type N-terminal cleavage/methylation domain-containing protein [Candidatus Moranbacteria bacterium]|nr:prepilin-type N-terminal cleavage/methylation domain-containing protein [Candidatus Moranbacteria bacterium]